MFDTTATNTGRVNGTNLRFAKSQETIMLELACRHHVYELHIKHFSEQLTSSKSVAPDNQLFKRLQNNWQELKHSIVPAEFKRYDVKAVKGTFLDNQIFETVQFCKMALNTEVFSYKSRKMGWKLEGRIRQGDNENTLNISPIYACNFIPSSS